MFVVQRAFTLVRRGYDPDEVDRHLELVSQWFTSTDIGRTFTRQRAELEQRERAVAAKEAEQAQSIEGARLEAEATLEGARRRADAESRAADQALAEARQEAAAIRARPSANGRSCSSRRAPKRPPRRSSAQPRSGRRRSWAPQAKRQKGSSPTRAMKPCVS
jgi:colicin import membrane protein